MERGLLQYEDLKEFKFEDWDGKPFLAFYTDFTTDFVVNTPDGEPVRPATQVIGYSTYHGDQLWRLNNDFHWLHVYRFEDNKHFFYKRLTYRQLSRWLAAGKGEVLDMNNCIAARIVYKKSESDNQVPDSFRIRTWDSEEWVEPTAKVLEELK